MEFDKTHESPFRKSFKKSKYANIDAGLKTLFNKNLFKFEIIFKKKIL